jgi:hypothetical protein
MIRPARPIKSLCIAAAVYSVLYFGANIYTHYRPLMTGQDLAILLWNLDAFLAPVVTGYVAAQLSLTQRIAMGGAAGLLAGCIAVTSNLFTLGPHPALRNAPWLLLYCILLGGIGGLLSWLQALILKLARRG